MSARASRICCRRSSRGSGSSSRRRRRRCRSNCSATTSRSRRPRSAATSRWRVVKGRQNYLCRRQLHGFQPSLLPDGRDGRAWEAMQGWLDETRDRRPGRARARAVRRRSGPSSPSAATAARGVAARSSRRCFAEAARERAGEADLVIANHALYFAHLAAGGGVLPEHDAVVFDEAHRLEESAASWLGGRVSRAGLRRLALDVERACRDGQKPLAGAAGRPGRARRRAAAARGRARRRDGAACARCRPRRRSC